MKTPFLCVLALSLAIACSEKNNQQHATLPEDSVQDTLAVLNDPKMHLNIQTNSFTEIDSSGILMFPLSVGETEREGERLLYKQMPNNGHWNIIFYNSLTGEYHLLSERKMLIENYNFKYQSHYKEKFINRGNHIFYSIRTDDYNKDNKLTEQDPQYLFISDKFGKNFRQISPTNHTIKNWEFIQSSNKVIMIVGKDSNNNKQFDNSDETATFEIDLENGTEANEVFPDDFKNKLKILFDRDWKRLAD